MTNPIYDFTKTSNAPIDSLTKIVESGNHIQRFTTE